MDMKGWGLTLEMKIKILLKKFAWLLNVKGRISLKSLILKVLLTVVFEAYKCIIFVQAITLKQTRNYESYNQNSRASN